MEYSAMTDKPDAAGLLAEARRLLRAEVLPGLSGKARFNALMIANALGIAEREVAAGSEREDRFRAQVHALGYESTAALNAALRKEDMKPEQALYEVLLADARARAAIVQPPKK